MKGFGTVITGTLLSGTISTDQEVEILPKGIKTKVRGIQSHNQAVQRSIAGQRTAVNLQGVEKDHLSRGDTIVSAGFFTPTKTLDAKLELLTQAPRGLKTGCARTLLQHDAGGHRQDHDPGSECPRAGRGSLRADSGSNSP